MRLPNNPTHVALDALGKNGPDRQLGLSTTPITVSTTGLSGITEPTAGSYDRQPVPASTWDPASNRAITADPVSFPNPDGDDWGVVVAYFLTDGSGTPEIPVKVEGARANRTFTVNPRLTSPL